MANEPLPYTGPLITRADALAQGLKRYFTGKPCARGHIAEHYVISCKCIICQRLLTNEYRTLNRTRHNQYRRNYYLSNRLTLLAENTRYRRNNREKLAQYRKDWAKRHPDRQRLYTAIVAKNRRARVARAR